MVTGKKKAYKIAKVNVRVLPLTKEMGMVAKDLAEKSEGDLYSTALVEYLKNKGWLEQVEEEAKRRLSEKEKLSEQITE